MNGDLERQLDQGLAALGLNTPGLRAGLLRYLELLQKWNKAYNLSAVRDPAEMVTRHLLDSLAVLPWVRGPRLLDIGSGPGLPGIPLALARPELEVVLLDSNGKKTRFLTQARLELGIANIQVVNARVEDYAPEQRFDTIISRAFAELGLFVELAAPLLAEQGALLAMKGRLDENELEKIPAERVKLDSHRLEVPGLDAERHLVHLRLTH